MSLDITQAVDLNQNTIECEATLSYVWECPRCKQINFRAKLSRKKDCYVCDMCKTAFDKSEFHMVAEDQIKRISENPKSVFVGQTVNIDYNTDRTKNAPIKAFPLIRWVWQCPSCNQTDPGFKPHDGGFVSCKNPKCQLRYSNAIFKLNIGRAIERLVLEIGVRVYGFNY